MKKKILFLSHAVTMAHVARPLRWAEALTGEGYEIHFGCTEPFRKLIEPQGFHFIEIPCIDPKRFATIVDQGDPIYDRSTFESHVQHDLELIHRLKPDLVIGDFRHSLSVSCRLAQVKYINITSAYWSPRARMPYPLPEAPIVRRLGETWARLLLGPFIPLVLKINFFKMAFLLRRSFSRANLKFTDYRDVITDGDVVTYFETEELVPLKTKFRHEKFMGPLIWSAPTEKPLWWNKLDKTKKHIWISLGSSGNVDILPMILATVSKFDVEVLVSSSGRKLDTTAYPNVYVTDFLPIEDACGITDVLICNGGSPMTHAALNFGKPVIGIICNNDQLLNMAHVENQNAGIMLRYWNITSAKLEAAIHETLFKTDIPEAAQTLGKKLSTIDVPQALRDLTKGTIFPL